MTKINNVEYNKYKVYYFSKETEKIVILGDNLTYEAAVILRGNDKTRIITPDLSF